MGTAKYPSTQQELYTACRVGWGSCKQHLDKFSAFKGLYTNAYIDDRLAAVAAAQQMPDEQARGAVPEILHIQLSEQNRVCLDLWQFLKRYILEAYKDAVSLQKPNLEAAGQGYYSDASGNNWDSTAALLNSGNNYIIANAVKLGENDNMPATFPAQFALEKDKFFELQEDFLDAEETAAMKGQAKIAANNALYDDLIRMFLDGQDIFKYDEATKKQFVFAEVLYLISGAGTSGIRGVVTDAQSTQTLMDVTVTISPKNLTTTTSNEGFYSILQVGQGIYNITFEKAGYQTQTLQDFEIKLGTTSKVDIALMPE